MYEKAHLRVHTHHGYDLGHFATVTVVAGGRIERLHTTRVYFDNNELVAWIRDFKRSLRDARCLWCSDNEVQLVKEIAPSGGDLDIVGYCSEECYTEALGESEAMARTER